MIEGAGGGVNQRLIDKIILWETNCRKELFGRIDSSLRNDIVETRLF